jgi:hypothetical protein
MMAKAKVTTIATASTRGTLILRSRSKSGVSTKLNKDGERERQQNIPRDIEHADDDGPNHQTLKQSDAALRARA